MMQLGNKQVYSLGYIKPNIRENISSADMKINTVASHLGYHRELQSCMFKKNLFRLKQSRGLWGRESLSVTHRSEEFDLFNL